MAADTFTGYLELKMNWQAEDSITGTDYSTLSNSSTITKKVTLSTDASNNAAAGADQQVSFIQSISASGNATLDMTNTTNILQQTSQAFARIKTIMFRLLSTSDDSTNGTNCTSATVGNAASNQLNLFLDVANSTFTLPNGGALAAIGNQTTGWLCNASQRNIKIVNNDGTNAAAFQISVVGGSS